ncbi:MAG TPA: hypothetical protein VKI65_16195, partial [Gemmataceae bacterium]|nr:hypothetical protein [Gemmataceae bacterium]
EADFRKALEASGLARLHAQGYRGRGVRVVVVDSDFRGYAGLIGKKLPKQIRLVDFTAERSPDLQPHPFSGDPKRLGRGTQCALAVAATAPEAESVLIRVDPAAPYQWLAIARYIQGEAVRSDSLDARLQQLADERERLRRRSEDLLEERRIALGNFGQDEASKKRREEYFQRQAELDRDEEAYSARVTRFLRLRQDVLHLRGVRVVVCPLVWNEGHPANGAGTLSRYFDDEPFRAALWFQATGETRGQTWYGLFHDTDNNGVMEFAPPGTRLNSGRWTHELNFLGWQAKPERAGVSDSPVADLPAKTRVRVSIQWREAHDPDVFREQQTSANEQATPDPYREPIANLRLLILRQRDPTGTQLPTDDMEVVARSGALPERLLNAPNFAVYEQTLEFALDAPGRLALRVEGRQPQSTLPANRPALPGQEKAWELRPRIFVQALDEASRAAGRPVFLDYSPTAGGIAVPAEAHRVIAVGAADFSGKPQPANASGPAAGMELLVKPDLLAYDSGGGTSIAASFAAGVAASALSGGLPSDHFFQQLRLRRGDLLRIPDGWPGKDASSKRR